MGRRFAHVLAATLQANLTEEAKFGLVQVEQVGLAVAAQLDSAVGAQHEAPGTVEQHAAQDQAGQRGA